MSSIGASRMPCRARSLTVALTFCPIFSTAGSSSTGPSSASAASSGTCPSTGSSKSPPDPGDVRERQVGRLARADGERDPDQRRRASRRRPSVSDLDRHRAALGDARHPAGQRRRRRGRARTSPGRSARSGTGSRATAVAGPCCASATGSITGGADPELRRHPAGEGAELHLARARAAAPRSRARAPRAPPAAPRAARRGAASPASREMRIWSAWPSSTSRRFGCLISPARASSVSRSPYSVMSCAAVLMPIPGAPGTLSTESPASACTSITRSGPTPNFSTHLVRPDRLVLQRVEHLDAGRRPAASGPCRREMIVTRPPAAAACVA